MQKNPLVTTNAQKTPHFLIDHPVKELLESEIQKAIRISKSGVNYALRDLVAANFLFRTTKKRINRWLELNGIGSKDLRSCL